MATAEFFSNVIVDRCKVRLKEIESYIEHERENMIQNMIESYAKRRFFPKNISREKAIELLKKPSYDFFVSSWNEPMVETSYDSRLIKKIYHLADTVRDQSNPYALIRLNEEEVRVLFPFQNR